MIIWVHSKTQEEIDMEMHLHIISKKQAKALGMKWFFTGKPCARGHSAQRNMRSECYECKSARNKKWKEDNKVRHEEYQRRYQEENRDYFRNYSRFSANCRRARERRKFLEKAGTLNVSDPIWQLWNKERVKQLRRVAKQYEEWTGIRFEVDHIVPIIDEKVCGLHWHGNLQLIPMRLNRLKRGIITHEAAA